jgi:hypothetical protein
VIFFFVIDQEELSLRLAMSLDGFNECLEIHPLVIGAPSKSRDASERDSETISYSEANRGRRYSRIGDYSGIGDLFRNSQLAPR